MKQERSYWCYPTVASMITGIPVPEIIEAIGHDGSRMICPERGDPWGRAAFEASELFLGMLRLGWAVVQLRTLFVDRDKEYPPYDQLLGILERQGRDACLVVQKGENAFHALYWDVKGGSLIDPMTGQEYDESQGFKAVCVEVFCRIA